MPSEPLPRARPGEIGLSEERLAVLRAAFQREIDVRRLPGVVILLARRGRIGWFESLGQRDPAAGDALRSDAIFRIYSMTKPFVSVAAMMLLEEGRLLLADPAAKYLPELGNVKVGVARQAGLELQPPLRPITVHDLLRHTSGLTYEFLGTGPVHKAYMDAKVYRTKQTNADQVADLGKLPLISHPGEAWHYGRSTDVLGRLVEVISGRTLGEFLRERIFQPLGMPDSGFHVPADRHGRIAEPFAKDPDTGADLRLIQVKEPATFESGGGGAVSTAMDYARFLQMLLNGGTLDGQRLLGRKTVELMTRDHLAPGVSGDPELLPPGFGFGLGFAVLRPSAVMASPGSPGQYYWGGLAGTLFWVDPAEQLFAIVMMQAPGQREHFRAMARNLVYSTLVD